MNKAMTVCLRWDTVNGFNFAFLAPTSTLPRWEREFMEGSDYARLQYSPIISCRNLAFVICRKF